MILTAGDSFTYGDELTDRVNSAWPYRLANMLSSAVLNLGESGASNDTIVRLILEQTCQHRFELVVVAWTNPERFEAWSELCQRPISIMHNSQAGLPWTDDYYRYSYNSEYSYQLWFHQVLLLQQYLNSINQPYLFVNVAGLYDQHTKNSVIARHIDHIRYPGWPTQGILEWTQDLARGPDGHPLEAGHQRIADKIYEYIRP
jgi:lysophospholipase L1-like esterase